MSNQNIGEEKTKIDHNTKNTMLYMNLNIFQSFKINSSNTEIA